MATTTNKNYYVAHVAPALMQHPTLSLYARTVGISLLMHRNNKTGLCYPEQTTIADELAATAARTTVTTSQGCWHSARRSY